MTKRKASSITPAQRGNTVVPFWDATCVKESADLFLPTTASATPHDRVPGLWYTQTRTEHATPGTLQAEQEGSELWRDLVRMDTASKPIAPPKAKKNRHTGKEETEPSAPLKTQKIRLFPSKEDRATLDRWIEGARLTYNRCVQAVEKEGHVKNSTELLRSFVNRDVLDSSVDPWLIKIKATNTHSHVRGFVVTELLSAYKAIATKKKNAPETTASTMKFRSHRDPQQSIYIPRHEWNSKGTRKGQFNFLKKIASSRPLPTTMDHDSTLTRTRLGKFYLCVPVPLEIHTTPESQQPSAQGRGAGVISLDPGVRTFLTAYVPGQGRVTEVGKGDMGRIHRMCHGYDQLQQKRDKLHGKEGKRKRYTMRKALLRIQERIRNLVDDLHKKTVAALLRKFKVVLLPKFETSTMVQRGKRRLNGKTAKAMLTWSHYRFRQRLLFKAQEYPACRVIICDEAYTSKTCGKCGKLHSALGGNKVFKCPSCGIVMDRDANGARNILLRFLARNTPAQPFSPTTQSQRAG